MDIHRTVLSRVSPESIARILCLPGMFVLGASVPNSFAAKTLSNARDVIGSMAKTGPTALELERARTEMLAEISGQESQEDMQEVTADNWLLIELYKLQPPTAQIRSLTLADLQRTAGRLFKEAAAATVIVGDAAQLKSNLGGAIEMRSAKPEIKTVNDPAGPKKKP